MSQEYAGTSYRHNSLAKFDADYYKLSEARKS